MGDELDQPLAFRRACRVHRRLVDDTEHRPLGQKSGTALGEHDRKLIEPLPCGMHIGRAIGAGTGAISDRTIERGIDGKERLPPFVALDFIGNRRPKRSFAEQVQGKMFGIDIGRDQIRSDRLTRFEPHARRAATLA